MPAIAAIRLKRDRDKPLRNRHPWIFSGGIMRVEGDASAGDVVRVLSDSGDWLGQAAFNPDSDLIGRVVSWSADERVDAMWVLGRVRYAIERRERVGLLEPESACRLVFGESDSLPGVVVDRYANVFVLSLSTPFAERHRETILDALTGRFPGATVLEHSEDDVREREGLESRRAVLAGSEPTEPVRFCEGNATFLADVRSGQKTGFYLDQRDNRARVARYASGSEVLNVFSYSGGFGIAALLTGAKSVLNVDTSRDALALGERIASLNGVGDRWESLEGNAFKVLREFRDAKRAFDLIVLDPPKFASAKAHVEGACRGYKDLNLLAMKVLRPGGILATFSCSGIVTPHLFRQVVAAAAMDCDRDVRLLEKLTQPADHPILMTFPESEYLKGFVLQVE
jgi:23S rRNA (cytosine1962-C5)-methyltransferase